MRIAKQEKVFRKGYMQNHTNEVFTVFRFSALRPPTYNLLDVNNVKIEGKFFRAQASQSKYVSYRGLKKWMHPKNSQKTWYPQHQKKFLWKLKVEIPQPVISTTYSKEKGKEL